MAGLGKVGGNMAKAIPVKVVGGGGPPAMSPQASAEEQEYKARRDHSTLQDAEEIKRDPKRMAAVRSHHRKKLGEMADVGETLGEKTTMGGKKRPAKFRMATGRARSGR